MQIQSRHSLKPGREIYLDDKLDMGGKVNRNTYSSQIQFLHMQKQDYEHIFVYMAKLNRQDNFQRKDPRHHRHYSLLPQIGAPL